MDGKAKVVLTDYVWESLEVEKKTLQDLADLVALQTKRPEEFLPQAEDCDALLNTYAGPITAEAMAHMPKCKIIARYGIGVDTIDVEAATQRGIVVMNTPFGNSITTAEHAIALMFALARQLPAADRSTQGGKWEKNRFMGVELTGKTLGIIGCGNIGSIVANFDAGRYFGVSLLQLYGMSCEPQRAAEKGVPPYPHMLQWVR